MAGDNQDPAARGFGQGYEYVATGFTFAFAILLFGAAGWALDGWVHTRPLFAIAGAFLGGFAGFMNIYYRVKRETEAGKREEGKGRGRA
jgi:F0F1-type ATP synthase assembly protein I